MTSRINEPRQLFKQPNSCGIFSSGMLCSVSVGETSSVDLVGANGASVTDTLGASTASGGSFFDPMSFSDCEACWPGSRLIQSEIAIFLDREMEWNGSVTSTRGVTDFHENWPT